MSAEDGPHGEYAMLARQHLARKAGGIRRRKLVGERLASTRARRGAELVICKLLDIGSLSEEFFMGNFCRS